MVRYILFMIVVFTSVSCSDDSNDEFCQEQILFENELQRRYISALLDGEIDQETYDRNMAASEEREERYREQCGD